ncbi:hypothetical protein HMI55_002856 [Coelomomyces lativittatus]|nr:hypothetical protein HMI55_002856 [Coelomomyces lativittatus]
MDIHFECDYPKFGRQVAEKVSKEFDVAIPNVIGIVICGSGIGISISSNKSNGIRCALCHDHYTAKMSRLHNNANILGLGGKVIGIDVAKDIVDVFLRTSFSLDQRHIQRLKLMHEMEKF